MHVSFFTLEEGNLYALPSCHFIIQNRYTTSRSFKTRMIPALLYCIILYDKINALHVLLSLFSTFEKGKRKESGPLFVKDYRLCKDCKNEQSNREY
jgi:hypothetical protein